MIGVRVLAVALVIVGGILVASGIHGAHVSTMARGLLAGRGAR
jgi:uncharacterized membrane protein